MFKYIALALVGSAQGSVVKQHLEIQTLNQVIQQLNILEKAKLNTNLEVELLDFLQNEMEAGSLTQMKQEHKSSMLGDTVMWMRNRFMNRPY